MQFSSKDILPACAYCRTAIPIDDNSVFCRRKGPRKAEDKCIFFRYDPLLRIPNPPPEVGKKKIFTQDDFKLD